MSIYWMAEIFARSSIITFILFYRFQQYQAYPMVVTDSSEDCGVVNVESSVDELLDEARMLLDDPLPLPNKNGLINLVAGQMWGLTALNRSGPVWVSCNASMVTLRFPISASKPLRARYEWDKKILSRTMRGVAYARVPNLEAVVTLQATRPEGDPDAVPVAEVTKVDIDRVGDVEVNVSDLGQISWLWSRAMTFMTNTFENALVKAVREKVRLAMNIVLLKSSATDTQLL